MTGTLHVKAAQNLSMPTKVSLAMSEITATLRYTAAAVTRGDPQERYETLAFVIESLAHLLKAGFCQDDQTGQVQVARPQPDKIMVHLTGRTLSPLLVGVVIRLLARHHNLPYHPMMDITGAKPLDYADTVAGLDVNVTTKGELIQAADFSGIDSLPLLPGREILQLADFGGIDVIEAERLSIPGKAVPDSELENALLGCIVAGLCHPLRIENDIEPEFYAGSANSVVIAPVLMDRALLSEIAAILPIA